MLHLPILGDSASITHKKRRVEAFGGGGGGVAPAPTTLAGPYSSTASVIVTSDRRGGVRLVELHIYIVNYPAQPVLSNLCRASYVIPGIVHFVPFKKNL